MKSSRLQIKRGKEVMTEDEGPRPGTTIEALAKLPPVFNHKSPVTGGPGQCNRRQCSGRQ